MDKNRKLDYVFFTTREFTTKLFTTIVDDLTNMLVQSCPEDKRISVVNFDQDDDKITNDSRVVQQIQLEYTTIKPDTNTASIQLCVALGLMASTKDDNIWYIVVDIPTSHTHLEYEFWIEKEENDTIDEATAYTFHGTSHSNGMPSDMTEYQGYKFYKNFIKESIDKVVSHAHVAVRTDPNDPDAFIYR